MIERLADPGTLATGSIPALPSAPPSVLGDDHLNDHFQLTSFLLNDSTLLEGLQSQYFIIRNEFDIKTKQGLKTLKGDRVTSFVWMDSLTKKPQVFINANKLTTRDGVPGVGFFQIISDGKLSLMKQTEVIFKEANYHVALNVGNQDHHYIKKTHLLYVIGNQFNPLPSKKQVVDIFPDHNSGVQKFIRVNSLDLSSEYHMQALFDYYNSLPVK